MINRLVFRLAMIAATLAVALSSVTPALANTTEKWSKSYSFDQQIGQCANGKNLMEARDTTDDFKFLTDKNGDPLKTIIHETGSSKAYLEGSQEKYVPGSGNWVEKVDGWDKQIGNFTFFSITGVPSAFNFGALKAESLPQQAQVALSPSM